MMGLLRCDRNSRSLSPDVGHFAEEDRGKLVGFDTVQGFPLVHSFAQARRDLQGHEVGGGVAVRGIQRSQIVQNDHGEPERRLGVAQPVNAVSQRQTVSEPGQGVGFGALRSQVVLYGFRSRPADHDDAAVEVGHDPHPDPDVQNRRETDLPGFPAFALAAKDRVVEYGGLETWCEIEGCLPHDFRARQS